MEEAKKITKFKTFHDNVLCSQVVSTIMLIQDHHFQVNGFKLNDQSNVLTKKIPH